MSPALAPLVAEVMAQPEAERLAYALELLEYHLAPLTPFVEGVLELGLSRSRADIDMLHLLDARRGHFVRFDALCAARDLGAPGGWCKERTVTDKICELRREIQAQRLPVEIEIWRGQAARLVAPDDFRFEDGRQARRLPLRAVA